jgi:cysteine synthase
MARFRSTLESVGNTPVVKINRLAPPAVNLHVKISRSPARQSAALRPPC